MKHPSNLDAHQIWPGMWLGSYPGKKLLPEFVVICASPTLGEPHPEGVFIAYGMHDKEGEVPEGGLPREGRVGHDRGRGYHLRPGG